ncbi:MAG: DUF1501 domain-containing protein, partial [Planctomycetota bacterium]
MMELCNRRQHLSRRTLLGAGGGVMLSTVARKLALASERTPVVKETPKSVILLWLEGGPSQLETFDPH